MLPTNKWFQAKPPGVKRVLFHSINHTGLGHLNRSIAVAQLLKADMPDVQVLFMIEGGEDFIEPSGFPWMLIPGHNQSSEAENIEYITRTALEVYQPDLMIYETVLLESMRTPVREAGVKEALMGNMGGLLRNQVRDFIAGKHPVDLLLVLQQPEEVTPDDRALVGQYTGRATYAGPLVRLKDQLSRESLRKKLGLADQHRVILLTFGGGGYDMVQQLLTNLLSTRSQILAACPEAKLVVISGPYFSGELPDEDEFICRSSRFEPFLTDYIDIASAVVCMAGYNTVNEIAVSGIPAVCVPVTEADDQVGRGSMGEYAERFPNMALGSMDTDTLALQVIEALSRDRDLSVTRAFRQRADGASRVIVNEMKRLLGVEQ
ncbi:MAG TPA: glycosyltransferase [Ktedonobacteraceae bacterium]|nr:glycosyltransferase [Ktedonobacteraceae bacterium]